MPSPAGRVLGVDRLRGDAPFQRLLDLSGRGLQASTTARHDSGSSRRQPPVASGYQRTGLVVEASGVNLWSFRWRATATIPTRDEAIHEYAVSFRW